MSFHILELPEELIYSIIEQAGTQHEPSPRPTKAGFQLLLADSSVQALSMTCRMLRRVSIPILFSAVRITPGFIETNTRKSTLLPEDLLGYRDALRLNTKIAPFIT